MQLSPVDQKDSGVHAVLTYPFVYKTFQRIVGIDAAFKKYLAQIVQPKYGDRVLDIGCGEGYILNFMPRGVQYVGYDISAPYIDYAKKMFGNRGTFINQRVSGMVDLNGGLFDIVLATGLLHHLNDEEGKSLFRIAYDNLKPGGCLYTYDNCFIKGQSLISRYISSKDRGQHVRYPEAYYKLGSAVFKSIEVVILKNVIRIPQVICVLKCRKD